MTASPLRNTVIRRAGRRGRAAGGDLGLRGGAGRSWASVCEQQWVARTGVAWEGLVTWHRVTQGAQLTPAQR